MKADLLIFSLAVRELLHPRRLLLAAPLILMPALMALAWRWLAGRQTEGDPLPGATIYNTLSGGLVFGFVLVLLAVMFGAGAVSGELESGNIVYLLTRPVHRARLLLARFLGHTAGITGTVWLSTLLLALADLGGADWRVVGRDLWVLALGALAYGGIFLLLSATVSRPLVVGLFLAFGWESWVPVMPGSFGRFSVMTYLRTLAPHPLPGDGDEELTGLFTLLNPVAVTPGHARWVLILLVLVAVGLALLTFSRREYVPQEET